jgi:hypothetical protein
MENLVVEKRWQANADIRYTHPDPFDFSERVSSWHQIPCSWNHLIDFLAKNIYNLADFSGEHVPARRIGN